MVVSASADIDILANGIYTQQQAAYLARLRPQTVSRWFNSKEKLGSVIKRTFVKSEDEAVVSFAELIQLMALRAIRLDQHISLQKIREVVARAEEMGFPYPLARSIQIFRVSNELVFKLPNGDYIQASGPYAKNYVMEDVILPYLEDINWSEEGIAQEYRPKNSGVILSPTRQWGAPVVESCNYTVAALVNAVHAEGSIEAAAEMCGVSQEDIKTALRYEDFLRGSV